MSALAMAQSQTPSDEGDNPLVNVSLTTRQKLDQIGDAAILDLVVDGLSLRDIAKTYSISLTEFMKWIAIDTIRSRAYACARIAAAESFDAKALEALEGADKDNISVRREIASHYRWKAKAANPRKYGEKSEVNLNAVVEQRLPLDQLQQEIQRLLSKSAIDVGSIDNDSLT